MSRSNPTPQSPVNRYFNWSGATGKLQYYDHEAEKRVDVKLPFRFLVLDELSTIGGYSDSAQSGIWSNDVRSTKDTLIVRTRMGVIANGDYASIKDYLKGAGGRYARSLFIAYQPEGGEDGELAIGKMKLVGSSLGAWFDFQRKNRVYDGGIAITGSTTDTKGSNTFHVPTFETADVSSEEDVTANDLDRELQAYLNTYLSRSIHRDPAEDADLGTDDDDESEPQNKPIDLSEIPF